MIGFPLAFLGGGGLESTLAGAKIEVVRGICSPRVPSGRSLRKGWRPLTRLIARVRTVHDVRMQEGRKGGLREGSEDTPQALEYFQHAKKQAREECQEE